MFLQRVLFTVAAASCWLTDTACSIQVIWTVQLAGPPPGVGGHLIVAVGVGSRAASDTPHRARSKAASCTGLQSAPPPAVPTQTRLGLLGLVPVRSLVACVCSAPSVEVIAVAVTVTVSGGVFPQY